MSTYRRRLLSIHESHFIKFEDPNTEELCLKYFDSDNNGRISFDDLTKVNSRVIQDAYHKINKDTQLKNRVIKFNEFKYFVGIKSIPYAFFGRFNNLEEIELPVVELLGNATFAYTYTNKLKKVIIPEGIKVIAPMTFLGALAPNSVIKIPTSITEIRDSAFSWKKDVTFIFYGNTPPKIVGNWSYSTNNKEKLIVGYAPDESVELYKNSPIIGKMCSDILPISQYKE